MIEYSVRATLKFNQKNIIYGQRDLKTKKSFVSAFLPTQEVRSKHPTHLCIIIRMELAL